MENEGTSGTGIEVENIHDPIPPETPAPGADDKKPTDAPPASEAEAQNSEDVDGKEATPEQREQQRESRRARANARKAADLAASQTEARMLREQIAKLEAQRSPPPADAEPKREDFDSLETYLEARADHRATQAASKVIEKDRTERQARETQARTVDADKRVAQEWEAREKAFRNDAKDYDDVVPLFVESELSDLDLSARRAILESDKGPAILYYLGKNEAEAERIAKLSPARQAAEIGKLEDKITPAKKTTTAPAPVSSVKGRSALNGYSENMNKAEFKAWSKAQGAKWAQ